MRTTRVLLHFPVALAVACSSLEPVAFDLGEVQADHAFLVTFGPGGEPRAVSRRFDPRDPDVAGPLRAGETAALVSFDDADVAGEVSEYLPGMPGVLEARVATPSDRLIDADTRREVFVPASAEVRALAPGRPPGPPRSVADARLEGRLRLVVPVSPCASPIGALGPFGARAAAIRADFVAVRRALRVDPDTLLVLSETALHLVRRNATTTSSIGLPRFDQLRPDETTAIGLDVALAPAAGPDGRREVLVAGLVDRRGEDVSNRGVLYRSWLGPAGLERPAVIRVEEDFALRAVALDAAGRALVAGDGGGVLVRSDPAAPFVAVPPLFDDPGRRAGRAPARKAALARVTGDPARPTLLAHDGMLAFEGPEPGTWTARELLDEPFYAFDPLDWRDLSVRSGPAGAAYLVVGERGAMARWTPSQPDWRLQPDLDYPASFAPCASSLDGGRLRFFEKLLAVAEVGQHVFLGHFRCRALVSLLRDGRCVRTHLPAGAAIRDDRDQVVSLLADDRELIVVLHRGEIWTAPLR